MLVKKEMWIPDDVANVGNEDVAAIKKQRFASLGRLKKNGKERAEMYEVEGE
jgi:hypothetical protein